MDDSELSVRHSSCIDHLCTQSYCDPEMPPTALIYALRRLCARISNDIDYIPKLTMQIYCSGSFTVVVEKTENISKKTEMTKYHIFRIRMNAFLERLLESKRAFLKTRVYKTIIETFINTTSKETNTIIEYKELMDNLFSDIQAVENNYGLE